MSRRLCGAFLLLLLAAAPVLAQDSADDATSQIAHLLAFIRASPCTFIRNGDSYDGPAAADHVRDKYEYYRDDIKSAEDFIDLAASRSALSGRAYQVRCPGSDLQPARDWLLGELASYRNQ